MSRMLSFAAIVAILISPIASLNQAVSQNTSPQKRQRPQPKPLRLQKVSPRLDQFLIDWYNATKQVKTLEGITRKFEYDSVFKVEKKGKGTFFYGTPDKGRLDIDPIIVKRGAQAKNGYSLQSMAAVKWISTGQNILQIDVAKKTGQRFKIPPENRGANIMHGPLPFLLGMPPDVIKRRYRLSIDSENATRIRLKAIPNWPHDIANYKLARIDLDKRTFMPTAVQMIDPTGNLETVYTFDQVRVNKKRFFWQKDPIAGIDLRGIKIQEMMPSGGQQRKIITEKQEAGRVRLPGNRNQRGKPNRNQPAKPIAFKKNPQIKPVDRSVKLTVPNLIGLNHADAKVRLRKAGFDVVFKRGSVARTKSLEWRVEHQNPKPKAVSYQGNKIELVLYIKPSDTKPSTRTASKRRK